jgi:tetratricopeptide (TPR) repeat protein
LKAIDIVCNQPSPPIWSWFTRATLNELKGDKEAAARDLENGFAGHAVEYQDFISRGLARMQTDPQAALLDFQAAEKMDPQPVEALQNQAHVEARYLNHTENAIDILQRLLKRNPDFLEARDALAVYYARLGQAEKALKIVSQMKAGEPSANAQYQTACVYALLAKKDLRYVPEALKQLASSLQRGFGFDYLMIDKDLDPVRNHPDFKVLSDFVQKTEQLKIAQP